MHNSQLSTFTSHLRVESLSSSSWFGVLVLLILVALMLSISAHRKQYGLYLRNFLNKQGRVMNYDAESTSVWANVLLWFVIISGFALLVKSYLQHFDFAVLFFVFAVCFGLKWLLFRFIGYLFGLKDAVKSFSTDYFVLIAIFGLVLLVIDLGVIYLPQMSNFVWGGGLLFLVILFLITLFIKLLQIFYTGISSLFYIFLYLCTSEILPLLLVIKWLQLW